MNSPRQAARVLCVDHLLRVLLLRWEDPTDGHLLWEPPGGGLEPGERPVDAARRELTEETGVPGSGVLDAGVPVHRDFVWNGAHHVGDETFFLAPFDHTPTVTLDGQLDYESEWFRGHRWVHWAEIGDLAEPVEPPGILEVLARLDPDGPWAVGDGGGS